MISFDWTPREKKLLIALVIVSVVAIGTLVFADNSDSKTKEKTLQPYSPLVTEKKESREAKSKTEKLVVDLKGAVQKPGIYEMQAPARVYQVVEKAGGANEQADLSQVNLAQMLTDGMVIYIPRKGEMVPVVGQASNGANESGTKSGKININTATIQDLEKLDGLGPSKAEAIVKYREEHGAFRSIDDLTKVPGIGEKTLQKFRDQITV
ncbi:helix-hairpin-helix domain-containing protein [Thermoflavimicrobium dichotomicum]|uniref:Competence protein ComEA n=1 Tax=Thermoflavimicrobium dichotomicum TaxID=46223 RepID=A0A1I3NLM1_9BACL|nr:helix-hairpin-helix domain-containing protein [Thermoflavimicrobium dichotomicum]SFJ10141.1 competence protein ComEA [Thermoflavimicrobium dichotomicum]